MVIKFYQKSKVLGQYNTPQYIAEYIVEQTLGIMLKDSFSGKTHAFFTILEPACGHGTFLIEALNIYLDTYRKNMPNSNNSLEKFRRQIITNSLYGIDIDSNAINKTINNIGASFFNANFKVLDALLPPPGVFYEFPIEELMKLRYYFKKIFIKGNSKKNEVEKLKKKISQIEKECGKELMRKMANDFQISPNSQIIAMPWNVIFPETNGMFDIIIGNPPWGSYLPKYYSSFFKFYKAGSKQSDSWSLFLEKCIKSLKPRGFIGFILPNTLLLNENYTSIRELLLTECRIKQIVNLGDHIFPNVTQPSVIIIAEKEKINSDHQINVIKTISSDIKKDLLEKTISLSSLPSVSCYQMKFYQNPDYQINIFSLGFEEIEKIVEKDLFGKQKDVKPLYELVTNARGVELNKKGKIYLCSYCGYWNSPPTRYLDTTIKSKYCVNPKCRKMVTEKDKIDFIIEESPTKYGNLQPFLVGYQIDRYFIKGQKYIDSTRKGINYKSPELYRGKKLLLRKTGHGIKLVIDYYDRWVSQVVYMFKLKKSAPVSLEYILGILNSNLILKYFYLKYADPVRREFPHFTQRKFLKIPIKIPLTLKEKELAIHIEKKASILQQKYQEKYTLFESKEQINQEINELENEVNNLIFELYKLTPEQCKMIDVDYIQK